MADGVLSEITGGIIAQLGNLALQEIGLLWGVKDELEKLKKTVAIIQAVLLDAEEKQALNNAIEIWLGSLKDVVFEADDLLDDFSTEALRREAMTQNKKAKKVRIFFSQSNQLAYGRKMGHKIKAIREKLDAIEANNKQFRLVERLNETQVKTRPRPETHFYEHAKAAIGRENEKEEIIKLILNSDIEDDVAILPIVGIGGMGKTTLAQLVFNDDKIKNHFELKLWVCVSDDFDVKLIVEKILEFAKNKKQENLDMNNLIKDLHKEIEGKRYFLVLDDVWNDDRAKWLSLKKLLMSGARGSTILVTTREEKVAKIVHTIEPYSLGCLNEHDSWSLFKKMAFEKGQEPKNPSFSLIGKEIVEKCRGIPLLINSIGGLLYFRNSEKDWLSFKNNELAKVAKETDVIPTLKLSYDHLPSHLKQCFAYCSLFPKDNVIDKETLIKLWMAQGFIRSSPDQSPEDIGHEYFMELLWRSFFQKDVQDELDELCFGKKYKMHDLMHDLATSVVGTENALYLKAGNINGNQNTHHISLGFTLDSSFQDPTPFIKASRTRTFLLPSQPRYGYVGYRLDESTCDAIFSSLKFLRLLDLHNMGIETVPSSISKLKHLRYLDLSSNTKIKMLPNSISTLQNLQTLKLSFCYGIKELPNDITKLVNLRYLELDSCYSLTHMPRGLGKLTNLRELSLFVMSDDSHSDSASRHQGKLKELSSLNNLRGELVIKNLRHGKDTALELKDANLKVKQYLQTLSLEWKEEDVKDADVIYDEQSLECLQPHPNLKMMILSGFQGVRFPSWLLSLTNLKYFRLDKCRKFQHLPTIDCFPSLKEMNLLFLDSLEYVNSGKFSDSPILQSLKRLYIHRCPNLKGWWRRKDSIEDGNYVGITATETSMAKNDLVPSFPCLSHLAISDCPQLTSMPLFPNLESLSLNNSSLKPLQQTVMRMTNTTPPEIVTSTKIASISSSSSVATSSFAPLSKLKRLRLSGMVEPLPEELLRNFTSINQLDIHDSCCPLTRVLRHLTALKSLYISDFEGDVMEWQELNCLSTLGFYNFSKVSLPIGLQHVNSLKSLEIQDCPSLMTIPECICNLTSLQRLEIWKCPNLTSFPEGIRALTSLQTLTIAKCPILLQRYKRETGEDWSKIAHIPNLEVYSESDETQEEPDSKKTWRLTKIFGH